AGSTSSTSRLLILFRSNVVAYLVAAPKLPLLSSLEFSVVTTVFFFFQAEDGIRDRRGRPLRRTAGGHRRHHGAHRRGRRPFRRCGLLAPAVLPFTGDCGGDPPADDRPVA